MNRPYLSFVYDPSVYWSLMKKCYLRKEMIKMSGNAERKVNPTASPSFSHSDSLIQRIRISGFPQSKISCREYFELSLIYTLSRITSCSCYHGSRMISLFP